MRSCLLTDVPRDRYGAWVTALLHAVMAVLQQPSAQATVGSGASAAVGGASASLGVASVDVGGAYELPPAACTDWNVTSYAVRFRCSGVDVDVFLSSDWSTRDADSAHPRYDALYDVTCQQTNHVDRYW